jgi:hypothetical protein
VIDAHQFIVAEMIEQTMRSLVRPALPARIRFREISDPKVGVATMIMCFGPEVVYPRRDGEPIQVLIDERQIVGALRFMDGRRFPPADVVPEARQDLLERYDYSLGYADGEPTKET